MSADPTSAAGVLARCSTLAAISARPDGIERVHLSPEHARANAEVAGWLRQAGLATWQDAAGNQWGRREGRTPGLPALVLGSHLDTVTDAGPYDGILGVALAIAVAQRLGERAATLPFALEVVGFADEEGTRFGAALLGSRAVAGQWDESWWALRDRGGVTLREASVAFGLDPDQIGTAARASDELVGYLEAHIEQGPELEAADESLGVVSSIAGARRMRLTVLGEARHAGGTPYSRRRDALAGASEIVLAIERAGRESGCIATVGQLAVEPGGVNVIPGRAELSVDLRAETDQARDQLWATLEPQLHELCTRRGLRLSVEEWHRATAVACAPRLAAAVGAGIGAKPPTLWSRAGHDAMAMAAITEVGMLFVRCHDGISHHPAESVGEIDVACALDALEAAVLHLAS